jgi:2-succinyl-5-enolpyruvyl-6-hydroxy-3-cyclohexene-1-carboxylate synthase
LDFGVYADFYGCGYELLGRAGDLEVALKAAMTAGGPQLIEVKTDRQANVEVHRRVWEAVEQAISRDPTSSV